MQMNVLRTKQVSHVRKVLHAKFNQFDRIFSHSVHTNIVVAIVISDNLCDV